MPNDKTIIALSLIIASLPAHALYKCTVDGVVKYQASPCPDNPDATPHTLDQPSPELQAKMRRQQLERNAEIAKQDLENAKRQIEIDRLNFLKRLDQDRVDNNIRYQQRMQQIDEQSRQTQLEIRCSDGQNRSDECMQLRYDKRWN